MPLFFINVRNSHDWGGDFAQYIHQAINITEGKPQWDNGYIFNPGNPYLAPQSYPAGFPVLLAPVYFFCGNSIMGFSCYITFLLVCSLVVMFLFLRRFFNYLISLLAVLVLAYNPWILMFKGEIISDIPFTLFFTLSILLYAGYDGRKTDIPRGFLMGLCIGFTMLIKGIGIILLLGIAADILVKTMLILYQEKRLIKEEFKFILIVIFTSISFYILVDKILLPAREDTFKFFSTLFDYRTLGNTMLITSDYYVQVIQDFFHPDNGKWNFLPSITKAFALSFFVLGLLIKCIKGPRYTEYIVLLYLFVILSFPNTTQGFRYLVPVAPLILFYIITGIQSVQIPLTVKPAYIALIIGFLILIQYKLSDLNIIATQNNTLMGPQEPEAVRVFGFIKENTPENSKIVFIKPTVLALYTGRRSFTNHPAQNLIMAERQYEKIGFDYLLTTTDVSNNSLDEYIKKHSDKLLPVYKNEKFELYKKAD
jgi:4-amino-4-deoxy-L-arabinose transferase-like glycosyltransferase